MLWLSVTLIISLFVLGTMYYQGIVSPLYINGEPITLREIVRVWRKTDKNEAFNRLVAQKIILYEAKKRSITVPAYKVNEEMTKISQDLALQGRTVGDLLIDREITFDEFRTNVTTTLLIYELLGKNAVITDKDIDDYLKSHDLYFEGTDKDAVEENVKHYLLNDATSKEYESWIREAKASSKVRYIINY